MGPVMIRCPETGRAIPTGFRARREDFGRTPVFMARTYCHSCGKDHEWFAKEAWVDDPRDTTRHKAA